MVQVSKIVKRLRQSQTKAEKLLWEELRGNQLSVKFKRQVPIMLEVDGVNKLYVVDFCCKRKKIVIEVDGEYHDLIREQDKCRDKQLTKKGFIVLRVPNDNIYDDICEVIDKVKEIINNRGK